jgi:exodeoxyribonuclease VII large subunit
MRLILSDKKSQFVMRSSKLEALNPLSVLTRGYSVVYKDKEKNIVKSLKDIEIDSEISVKLSDGFADAKVVKKRKK